MKVVQKKEPYMPLIKVLGIFVLLSFVGFTMVTTRIIVTQQLKYAYLIWNLFLTWIPLIISIFMMYVFVSYKPTKTKGVLIGLSGIAWLFFYPNAPYIITDFIHLSSKNFYLENYGYNTQFIIWYDFVMMSLFILTGFLIGFLSLFLLHGLVKTKINDFIGWLFVLGTLFLSSFGIYLGRFIRWNTWDVLFNPILLISSVIESIHLNALAFTFTFGLFLILIYFALYYLTRLNEIQEMITTKRE